jgi:hypothetical protein
MTNSRFEPKSTTTQKVVDSRITPKKSKYDQIWTIQQAINMAVAEKRVVRFLTDKTNKQIKKEIDDIKGCALRKPDKDSNEVAILPPGVEDFCFEDEIDTSLIIVPKPKIWTP